MSTIKTYHLPSSQYLSNVREMTDIKQVVLHHTCGGSAQSAIDWWNKTPERVGTNLVIDNDGTVYEAIPLHYWAYHLAISSRANANAVNRKYRTMRHDTLIAKQSLGIEIVSYGELKRVGNALYTIYNMRFCSLDDTESYVKYENKFRDFEYFARYTEAQMSALKDVFGLLKALNLNIDYTYKPEMWDLCENAIKGESGIWAHTSFRIDKSDCHPQPELVELLKSLK